MFFFYCGLNVIFQRLAKLWKHPCRCDTEVCLFLCLCDSVVIVIQKCWHYLPLLHLQFRNVGIISLYYIYSSEVFVLSPFITFTVERCWHYLPLLHLQFRGVGIISLYYIYSSEVLALSPFITFTVQTCLHYFPLLQWY
jgi:hypothetical protein